VRCSSEQIVVCTGAAHGMGLAFSHLSEHRPTADRHRRPQCRAAAPDRHSWPSLADLASRGVARISFGPGLYRASQALLDWMLTKVRGGADPYA
jgi:hypothetical protein